MILCLQMNMNFLPSYIKRNIFHSKYKANKNATLNWLEIQWKVDGTFEGDYVNDYLAIQNETFNGVRTPWSDGYTTSLYNVKEDVQCRRYEL